MTCNKIIITSCAIAMLNRDIMEHLHKQPLLHHDRNRQLSPFNDLCHSGFCCKPYISIWWFPVIAFHNWPWSKVAIVIARWRGSDCRCCSCVLRRSSRWREIIYVVPLKFATNRMSCKEDEDEEVEIEWVRLSTWRAVGHRLSQFYSFRLQQTLSYCMT